MLSDGEILRLSGEGEIAMDPPLKAENLRPTGVRVHLDSALLLPRGYRRVNPHQPADDYYFEATIGTNPYILEPQTFILGSTVEKVRLNPNLVGFLDGRSTLARLGLHIHCGSATIDNNTAELRSIVCELYNAGPFAIELELGMPIGMLLIYRLAEPILQPSSSQYANQRSVTAAQPDRLPNQHRGD